MFINNWIVIQIQRDRVVLVPGDVIFTRVFPPLIKGTVVISTQHLVIQSQTETGTRESVGPDFCVFTMAAYLAVMPLPGKVRRDL